MTWRANFQHRELPLFVRSGYVAQQFSCRTGWRITGSDPHGSNGPTQVDSVTSMPRSRPVAMSSATAKALKTSGPPRDGRYLERGNTHLSAFGEVGGACPASDRWNTPARISSSAVPMSQLPRMSRDLL